MRNWLSPLRVEHKSDVRQVIWTVEVSRDMDHARDELVNREDRLRVRPAWQHQDCVRYVVTIQVCCHVDSNDRLQVQNNRCPATAELSRELDRQTLGAGR